MPKRNFSFKNSVLNIIFPVPKMGNLVLPLCFLYALYCAPPVRYLLPPPATTLPQPQGTPVTQIPTQNSPIPLQAPSMEIPTQAPMKLLVGEDGVPPSFDVAQTPKGVIENQGNLRVHAVTMPIAKDLPEQPGLHFHSSENPFLDGSWQKLTNLYWALDDFNVEVLNASHNLIEDISPLVLLENLRSLDISHNRVVDVCPIYRLRNLVYVNIKSNPELKTIGCLKKLKFLPPRVINEPYGLHFDGDFFQCPVKDDFCFP